MLYNWANSNLYEMSETLFDKEFTRKGYSKIIGDYIEPRRGKNLLKEDAVQGKVPVVAGGLDPSTYHNKSNTGAPVITISASGANAGFVNLWEVPVWSSDSSFIDNSVTLNVYFWYVLLKKRQKEIYDSQTGSAQPHVYPMHIMNLPMTDISETEIKKFNINVEPLFRKIGKLKKENKTLSQLRDTLLPKLMNGDIDLNNIEIEKNN